MVSASQLRAIMPQAGKKADLYAPLLSAAMERFGIDTPRRAAAFLAQVAHESGQLRYVRELASGEAYDTGRKAEQLGNTPEADGDGQRYKGRGLIQVTGRANYALCGLALDLPLIERPELLEEPEHAAMSAAWFWWNSGLNALADRGDFGRITRRINGGLNGFEDRRRFYAAALQVLGKGEWGNDA